MPECHLDLNMACYWLLVSGHPACVSAHDLATLAQLRVTLACNTLSPAGG